MLTIDLATFKRRLADHSKRVEQMRLSLESLYETHADLGPRARPIAGRRASDKKDRLGSR